VCHLWRGRPSKDAKAGEQAALNCEPCRSSISVLAQTQPLIRMLRSVERFFNRIKQCRRSPPRYDKITENFLAFVKLPAIRMRLRVKSSD
jgi:transposase